MDSPTYQISNLDSCVGKQTYGGPDLDCSPRFLFMSHNLYNIIIDTMDSHTP